MYTEEASACRLGNETEKDAVDRGGLFSRGKPIATARALVANPRREVNNLGGCGSLDQRCRQEGSTPLWIAGGIGGIRRQIKNAIGV